jgi:hypothetical protein
MSLFNEPFDLGDQRVRELLRLAYTGYSSKDQIGLFASRIGIPSSDVDWDGALADVWPRILTLAARRGLLRELVKALLENENYAQVRPRIEALFAAAEEEERDEAKRKVAPERSIIAERTKIGAILRLLAELSYSLTDMTSWPSWTPERRQRESTVLRARLVTLDGYLGELPSEYHPRPGGMREIIRLDVSTAKVKGLTQDIQESLNGLQNSALPSGVRARELSLFAMRSTDFKRAARQLQQLLQP